MKKSIKFKNDYYLDSKSICHDRKRLDKVIDIDYIDNQIIPTNEFLNGKRIYVKRFIIESLPNSTSINYKVGLPSNITVVKLDGLYGEHFPINFIYPININLSVGTYWYGNDEIQITTGSNRSSMSGHVDIYFIYK